MFRGGVAEGQTQVIQNLPGVTPSRFKSGLPYPFISSHLNQGEKNMSGLEEARRLYRDSPAQAATTARLRALKADVLKSASKGFERHTISRTEGLGRQMGLDPGELHEAATYLEGEGFEVNYYDGPDDCLREIVVHGWAKES